jgi:hypothetical protein
MDKDKFSSKGKNAGSVDWYSVSALLEEGRYPEVGEILRNALGASQEADNLVLVKTLEAARQVCMVCSQFQAETARYQRAYEDACQREKELRQQLLNLLDLAQQNVSFNIYRR